MADIKNKRVKFFETDKDSKYKDLADKNENVVFFDTDSDPTYFSIKLNGKEYSGTQLIKDTQKILQDNIDKKQNILVDHKNIKTINDKTLLLDEKAPKDVNLSTADIGGVYHYESTDNQDINGPKTFNKYVKFKQSVQVDGTTILNGLTTIAQQIDISESKKPPFKLNEGVKDHMVKHLNVEYLGGKNLQTIESEYNKIIKNLSDKLYNETDGSIPVLNKLIETNKTDIENKLTSNVKTLNETITNNKTDIENKLTTNVNNLTDLINENKNSGNEGLESAKEEYKKLIKELTERVYNETDGSVPVLTRLIDSNKKDIENKLSTNVNNLNKTITNNKSDIENKLSTNVNTINEAIKKLQENVNNNNNGANDAITKLDSEVVKTITSANKALIVASKDNNRDLRVNVNSGDGILSIGTNGIESKLNLTYDNKTGVIKLIGNKELASVKLLVDQLIEYATVSTNIETKTGELNIKFLNSPDIVTIDVSKLVDIYNSGNGIKVNRPDGKPSTLEIDLRDGDMLKFANGKLSSENIQNKIDAVVKELNEKIETSVSGGSVKYAENAGTADVAKSVEWNNVKNKKLSSFTVKVEGVNSATYNPLDVTDKTLSITLPKTDWNSITGKPTEFKPIAHNHNWSEINNKPVQATRWPNITEVPGLSDALSAAGSSESLKALERIVKENIKMSGSSTPLFKDGQIIIPTIAGPKGDPGVPGKDGVSPTLNVSWNGTGDIVTINGKPSQSLKGPKGDQGVPGIDGKDGTGINILGNLNNISQLPSSGTKGDAYLIDGVLYVYVGSGGDVAGGKWQNAGNIKGPKGDDGQKGDPGKDGITPTLNVSWNGNGDIVTINGKPSQSLKGPQGVPGKDGISPKLEVSWNSTKDVVTINGLASGSLIGPQGPKGVDGKDGTGVNILGTLSSTSQLPSSGTKGDAYLINGVLYVYVGSGGDTNNGRWQNAGDIKGPKGDPGTNGKDGKDGVSPTLNVSWNADKDIVTINGQSSGSLKGPKGVDGKDGVSPTLNVSWNGTGDIVTINGKPSQSLKGPQGIQGNPGQPGKDGEDGRGIELTNLWGQTITPNTKSVTGSMTISGTVTSSEGFYEDSDKRLKENIKQLSSDGDVTFVEFNYIADESNKLHYGVIAQELERVYPDLVKENKGGFKSVNYIELLIMEVVKLRKRVEELEKKK